MPFVLAACGGSSGGSTNGGSGGSNGSAGSADLASAQKAITDAEAVPKFQAPGPAFDVSAAKGKVVYVIVQQLSVPFDKAWSDALTAALKRAGVDTVIVESQANPAQIPRLVQQAIGRHVDGIVIEGIPTQAITQPLKAAKDAGIPVVKLYDGDPQLPENDSYAAEVTYCYSCAGRLLADWSAIDSKGHVNAAAYWNTEPTSGPIINAGMKDEYKKICPDTCKADFKELSITAWATRLPTMTSSDLLHKPAYNYFLPNYDGMLTYMAPALRKAKDVRAASFNSDLPVMQMLQKGDVVDALVGSPVEWMGWAIADQTLRVLTGQKVVESENVPLRVFDKTNIGPVDLTKPESEWYDVDFISEYLKLWKLSS